MYFTCTLYHQHDCTTNLPVPVLTVVARVVAVKSTGAGGPPAAKGAGGPPAAKGAGGPPAAKDLLFDHLHFFVTDTLVAIILL